MLFVVLFYLYPSRINILILFMAGNLEVFLLIAANYLLKTV